MLVDSNLVSRVVIEQQFECDCDFGSVGQESFEGMVAPLRVRPWICSWPIANAVVSVKPSQFGRL